MRIKDPRCPLVFGLLLSVLVIFYSCNNVRGDHGLSSSPEETDLKASDQIRQSLQKLITENGKLTDSIRLRQAALVKLIYERSSYTPVWSHQQKWLSPGDSLFEFIKSSKYYGLFPEDYHYESLNGIREQFRLDSNARNERRDPELWSRADMLLTDAFMSLVHDVKLGRLPVDSLTQRKDSILTDSLYVQIFDNLQGGSGMTKLMTSLEPKTRGYQLLKAAIPLFLGSTDPKNYTIVPSPGKKDPGFRRILQKRLFEGGYISYDSIAADSAQLTEAVKNFQKQKGITVDGVAGEGTVRMLNVNDHDRFVRIAISMDKYKLLPDQMPSRYIWVNSAGNFLELIENGGIKFSSRVITGKPHTRTPSLTSQISELITYPQWVPPPSIVSKEILPAVKKNPSYLARKGFSLQDRDGNEVNPDSVDWSQYKTMPYRVVQGSGDANALGIMKFVFSNKYSVYLHDTNQRYLFGNAMRSLSHGCVRVQEWEKLTYYILNSDYPGKAGEIKIDSVKNWLKRKEKRSIAIRNKLPVYIRYFTCEGNEKGVAFYDDIYGEDKYLREKYFAGK